MQLETIRDIVIVIAGSLFTIMTLVIAVAAVVVTRKVLRLTDQASDIAKKARTWMDRIEEVGGIIKETLIAVSSPPKETIVRAAHLIVRIARLFSRDKHKNPPPA